MNRAKSTTAALMVTAGLLPAAISATTREIAVLKPDPLTSRRSVLNQLSRDVFWDPYDELQRRPFNLPFANMDRHGNLSPWPGQNGAQGNYINALIGNNGDTNVQNSSDVITGAYMRQPGDSFGWGLSASFLTDDTENTATVTDSAFSDSGGVTGFDFRFALGYRLSDGMSLGGGIDFFSRDAETTDFSFDDGTGGFFGSTELQQSGANLDFGVRGFMGERSSWQGQLLLGVGTTELLDFTDTLDDTGAVSDRFVLTKYDIGAQRVGIAGAYNRLYAEDRGELQLHLEFGTSEHSLDNTDLRFNQAADTNEPDLEIELLGQSPVREDTVVLAAHTVNRAGSTQIFSGARLSFSKLKGSTVIESLGTTTVDEAIDDQVNRLGLTLGLRQPLGTEKLRLIASAHSDWLDEDINTAFATTTNGTDFETATVGLNRTRTMSRYALGLEGVFANVTFDLAWLFGEEFSFSPGGDASISRQVIEFDRLVVSAMFAW